MRQNIRTPCSNRARLIKIVKCCGYIKRSEKVTCDFFYGQTPLIRNRGLDFLGQTQISSEHAPIDVSLHNFDLFWFLEGWKSLPPFNKTWQWHIIKKKNRPWLIAHTAHCTRPTLTWNHAPLQIYDEYVWSLFNLTLKTTCTSSTHWCAARCTGDAGVGFQGHFTSTLQHACDGSRVPWPRR